METGQQPPTPPSTSSSPSITIRRATTPEDLAQVKALFTAYTASLNLDLSFQNYASELTSLPGAYGPPTGILLLATSTSTSPEPLGCIALRPLPLTQPQHQTQSNHSTTTTATCEMKRLYVAPAGRGQGVGEALVRRVLDEAKAMRYRVCKLDTLGGGRMDGAMRLYRRFGFGVCGAYHATPVEGTVFLELDLGEDEGEGEG